jgi:hypothetical protein
MPEEELKSPQLESEGLSTEGTHGQPITAATAATSVIVLCLSTGALALQLWSKTLSRASVFTVVKWRWWIYSFRTPLVCWGIWQQQNKASVPREHSNWKREMMRVRGCLVLREK